MTSEHQGPGAFSLFSPDAVLAPSPALRALRLLAGAALCSSLGLLASCSGGDDVSFAGEETVGVGQSAAGDAAVGLALQIENGIGIGVSLRKGQRFYLNQLDIRASAFASVDEGVSALDGAGDFASLAWSGLHFIEQDVDTLPNSDGTFTRHRYYRDANWMRNSSTFTLDQLDGARHVIGQSITVSTGKESQQKPQDGFFVRRMRAIQWTRDCPSPASCQGADQFEEEALVELRDAIGDKPTFTLHPSTASLRLRWSARGGAPWVIPVTQVASPSYAYGFSIDIDPVTAPGAGGVYPPGSDVTFRATLRDGAGAALHPPGLMPSYFEAEILGNPAGIQYYHGFFDPTILYYRRKHTERSMMAEVIGPSDDVRTIRSVVGFPELLDPSGVQHVGIPARDGFYADVIEFPRAVDLIAGAFDPTHAAWFAPVSDTFTVHLPDDAAPGTYFVSMKARRVYLGEDLPFTRTITVQVGTPAPTVAPAPVGGCAACHTGGGSLSSVAHANNNLGTCAACHAPLALEPNNPIYVRAHFIHSRAGGRFDRPLDKCATCHTSQGSIQRASKSACLSCHTSYPASHVAQFGPVVSPFIGGGFESFEACGATCHADHPGSGFGGCAEGDD
ncbi:MAG: cytochrome c3 family protein [Byssovorax sp.]